ncbi:MAG: transposase [Cytophagales bacterium]|nr:transposase [Cytophaga sp.]
MKKWLLPMILFFTITHFGLSKTIIIDDSVSEYNLLSNEIEIFEDITNQITFQDIQLNPALYPFSHYKSTEQFSKHPSSVYWIRFNLQSDIGNTSSKWILEILDSRFKEVIFYKPDENRPGAYKISITGTQYPFLNREYEHKNFVFDVPILNDHQPHIYYLKITPDLIGSFFIKLRQNKVFSSYAFKEHLLLGMYYGILLIMAFYNLFIYFSLRERVYIYYFFYVIAWALHSSFDDGLGFEFIWSNFSSAAGVGYYTATILLVTFYVLYSQSFLNLDNKQSSSRFNLYPTLFIYSISSVILIYLNQAVLYNLVFTITYAYILYVSVRIYKTGYKPARFFILGNGIIVCGLIIYMLRNAGTFQVLISGHPFLLTAMVYIRNIIMVIDIVILSMALGDRLRFFKQSAETAQLEIIYQLSEKKLLAEKVNAELEQKVEERTKTIKERTKIIEEKKQELEEANTKLKQQAEEINKMNALLDLDNWNLKKNIIQEKEARIVLKEINFEEFKQVYPNESACFHLLEEIKWENGYKCRKCDSVKYNKGIAPFSRRCSNCRYDESITSYTVFHRCRFEIQIALYMAVMVNRYGKEISVTDISREVKIRNATCWKFTHKLLVTIDTKGYRQVSENDKLKYLILHS